MTNKNIRRTFTFFPYGRQYFANFITYNLLRVVFQTIAEPINTKQHTVIILSIYYIYKNKKPDRIKSEQKRRQQVEQGT